MASSCQTTLHLLTCPTPFENAYTSFERSRLRRIFQKLRAVPVSSMYSQKYDPLLKPSGVCKNWYEGRGCLNVTYGLSCRLHHSDDFRDRNLCSRYAQGENCQPYCAKMHGDQVVFDVHTWLLNRAAESPTWQRAIVEVNRVLSGAPPILAVSHQDHVELEAEKCMQPVPGIPVVPLRKCPPSGPPSGLQFFDISADTDAADDQPYTGSNAAALNVCPWEAPPPPASYPACAAVVTATAKPKPPPLPPRFKGPPVHYAQAAAAAQSQAHAEPDFEC